MLSQSAWAIVLVALLVAPVLPLASASSHACDVDACRLLVLYAHSTDALDALSTLPGDRAPGDPATVSTGSIFRASTAALPAPIALAADDAFRAVFVSASAPPGYEGVVRVRAVDLTGGVILLAEGTLRAGLPPPAKTASESTRSAWDGAMERVGGPLAEGVLGACPAAACGPFAPSFGVFQPCGESAPSGNLPAFLVHTVVQTADRAVEDAAGERACGRAPGDAMTPTAAALDDALSPLRPTPPPYPGPQEEAATWDLTLDAKPPAWMSREGGAFVLPSGMRLEMSLESMGDSSATFSFGHARAPTRLEVRTPTPGAFGMLVHGARAIAPGDHVARFQAQPYDVADFTLEVPPGRLVEIAALGDPLRFTLLSPDGEGNSTASLARGAGEEGRWTLRVARGGPDTGASHAFSVRLADPSRPVEKALRIEEGTVEGSLGPADDRDAFVFYAWQAQRFSVRIESPPDASYQVLAMPVRESRADETDPNLVHARAIGTGLVQLDVVRAYGEGPYRLTLDLDEPGNLSVVPKFGLVWNLSGRDAGDIQGYAGGVDIVVDGVLYHRQPHAGTALVAHVDGDIARNAAGEFLYESTATGGWALAHRGHGVTTPFFSEPLDLAFGGDGALYARRWGGNGSEIVRIRDDRTVEHVADTNAAVGSMLSAPDGRVLLAGHGEAYRLDTANGSFERVPELRGVHAFDAEGRGYRLIDRTLVVRVDAAGGDDIVVARSDLPLVALVASGTRLWGLTSSSSGLSLVSVDVGVPMFEGFHGAFQPAAASDLRIASVEEEHMGLSLQNDTIPGEDIRHRVTVRNDGAGRARPTEMYVFVGCQGCWQVEHAPWRIVSVPALEAGERAVIIIDWHATVPGDRRYTYHVDFWREEAETKEQNNGVSWKGHVLVDAPDVAGAREEIVAS